jgi:putative transposase
MAAHASAAQSEGLYFVVGHKRKQGHTVRLSLQRPEDGDQEVYRDLLAGETRKARVDVWAYCLMPNHVRLILNPTRADGLGLAVGEAHRRYTNFINARGRWTGHLFQSWFASVAMDELHR